MNKRQRLQAIHEYAGTHARLEYDELLTEIESSMHNSPLLAELNSNGDELELVTLHGNIYLLQLLNITNTTR